MMPGISFLDNGAGAAAPSRRAGLLAVLTAIALAGPLVLAAGPLPLYPGAKLDQEYERDKIRNAKIESKQYITSDAFDKVTAFYKKLAPEAPEWTINLKDHKRMAFREKGDQRNATTVEWSTEDPADKDKTFIIVNTDK